MNGKLKVLICNVVCIPLLVLGIFRLIEGIDKYWVEYALLEGSRYAQEAMANGMSMAVALFIGMLVALCMLDFILSMLLWPTNDSNRR